MNGWQERGRWPMRRVACIFPRMLRSHLRHPRFLACALALVAAACSDAPTGASAGVGRIAVTVTGRTGPAAVLLLGPAGAAVNVVNSGTVDDLAAGAWTIRTNAVGDDYPIIAEQQVTVAAGKTVALRAGYAKIPVQGTGVPALIAFDDTVLTWMAARGIEAGVVAVQRGGAVVFSRAYGWKDSLRSTVLPAGTPMRVASLTKPLTQAAIRRLVAGGAIQWNTPVIAYLGLSVLPVGTLVDPRMANITVQHLFDHTAGIGTSGWIPSSRDIATALGLTVPPTRQQVAQWVLGQPLTQNPGVGFIYSNMGYLLLGLVIEKAGHVPYLDYLRDSVMSGGSAEFSLARTRPEDRDVREPFYGDPWVTCSVFSMTSCVTAASPSGGFFAFEQFAAFGGLVTTPESYLRFMARYWGHGGVRGPGEVGDWELWGSIDGTRSYAIWRPDGTLIVAFFNRRAGVSDISYDDLGPRLKGAANATTPTP